MTGREFLVVARETVRGRTEAHWRAAAGRSYYALMLELRGAFARWGLTIPSPVFVHQITLQRTFASTDQDIKQIGRWLEELRRVRGLSDYDLAGRPDFATDVEARRMIRFSTDALAHFDAIDADLPRRTAIAAQIRKVFP